MTIADKLNLFFESPTIEPAAAGVPDTSGALMLGTCKRYSTLYLLRRDVDRCLTANPPIYWPGIMAMLAGIDLMAKLYDGDDKTTGGAIGTRFKKFVEDQMSAGDGDAMWKLRNAILHSYGVYFEESPPPPPPGGFVGSAMLAMIPKRFRLTASNAPAAPAGSTLFNTAGLVVEIDVQALTTSFAAAVTSYETLIRTTTAEQPTKFEPMFDKYGWLFIHEHTYLVNGNMIQQGASGG